MLERRYSQLLLVAFGDPNNLRPCAKVFLNSVILSEGERQIPFTLWSDRAESKDLVVSKEDFCREMGHHFRGLLFAAAEAPEVPSV